PSFWHMAVGWTFVTGPAAAPVSACSCPRASATTNLRTDLMTQQSILVVDDEAPMRKLLASNLKASGYAVRAATDGTEALKLIEEHPFDLLLLDVNMPGPNGLQVLQAFRRTAEMPVLILSGRGRE